MTSCSFATHVTATTAVIGRQVLLINPPITILRYLQMKAALKEQKHHVPAHLESVCVCVCVQRMKHL